MLGSSGFGFLKRSLFSAVRYGKQPMVGLRWMDNESCCIRPSVAFFCAEPSSSSNQQEKRFNVGGGGGGEKGVGNESISFAEAKKLMRLVNVEALKRKLGMEEEEVIMYTDLLKACESMGVARSSAEAASFVRVLDEAGVILLFRDKVYLHPDKVVDLVRRAVPLALSPEDDPRRDELKRLRQEKQEIDMLAHKQVRRILWKSSTRVEVGWIAKCCSSYYSTMVHSQMEDQCFPQSMTSSESRSDVGNVRKHQLGENVSRKDKVKFLVDTLLDLKESKEDAYGALDAWVAWEPNFPLASLKRALITLEKEQQWHRVIQVIKWMLSKGQGTTMGTYGQLIRALDMDHRTEEAHNIWAKKIGYDLHSVSWQLCNLMISIYYRNNMLERLVKLFKGLEAFDRKPPEKSVVQKVANAYELLGLPEEQKRVLEKYNSLFTETWNRHRKSSKKASKKKSEKSGQKNSTETSSDNHTSIVDDV